MLFILNVGFVLRAIFRCLLKSNTEITKTTTTKIIAIVNPETKLPIEGEGVGDEVGPKLGGEGVGVKVRDASEIGNMIGLLSWLYASMMYGVSPMPSLLASVPL